MSAECQTLFREAIAGGLAYSKCHFAMFEMLSGGINVFELQQVAVEVEYRARCWIAVTSLPGGSQYYEIHRALWFILNLPPETSILRDP